MTKAETIKRDLPGMQQCRDCGGVYQAIFKVWGTGYSAGAAHKHAPDCPQLRCSHGVLWADDCDACDAESDARREDEDGDGW